MGTIVPRKRQDGTTGYTAQIRIKRKGAVVHSEAQTFDRKAAATAWLRKRETELTIPGALEKAKVDDPTFGTVINRYVDESRKEIGRTKAQVLRTIKAHPIADLPCSAITAKDWSTFASGLTAQPQTVANYMAHLGAVVAIAKPLWGYPLDREAFRTASVALRQHGIIGKSVRRDRRPTVAEMSAIVAHFLERTIRVPQANPMAPVVVFAMFSTRRLEEILRVRWSDLREDDARILVRDMKNPGEKVGNNVWCDLPPEALRIVRIMPRSDARIFPYGTDAVGMAFTRAVRFLEIDDLHFHDLRHEGASRLIEMGWSIPRVAAVTGHRSWDSLKRYAHHRQAGDKWADWPWLDVIAPLPQRPIGVS